MASKIKVDTIENVAGSGNVSLGSGHNLVVPGNITGQGTTTLTDDLTVDTNTLFVDASTNRVGVGTTSPNNPLEISHTGSAGAGGLRIGDPSTIASDTGIYLRTTGDAVIGAAGGDIVFDTNMAVQEDMRIDSSGRVTMPRQPSFQVKASPSVDGNGKIHTFGTIISNVGSHWNNGQGKFTAPVAGVYLFYAHIWPSSGMDANNTYLTFQKNGQEFFGGHTTTNRDGITIVGNITLAVNDYVNLDIQGGWPIQGSDPRNNFGGHLIG